MAELLRMKNITMRYPNGVLANDRVKGDYILWEFQTYTE